ncbi:MAG TPA: hypothetical protein VJB89_01875 [Candidatus Nanoarchaeia archaeon]|nr:hypothetical protein [Candidatus Nanoarchaeia archaeon]
MHYIATYLTRNKDDILITRSSVDYKINAKSDKQAIDRARNIATRYQITLISLVQDEKEISF